jgi:hypothetical protein
MSDMTLLLDKERNAIGLNNHNTSSENTCHCFFSHAPVVWTFIQMSVTPAMLSSLDSDFDKNVSNDRQEQDRDPTNKTHKRISPSTRRSGVGERHQTQLPSRA